EEVALQRRDDRDAAADARFEEEVDVLFLGEGEQAGAVLRHYLFIRGDDVLAGVQRPCDVVERGRLAAHDLDDDVDFPVVEDAVGVTGEDVWRGIVARLRRVTDERAAQDKLATELTAVVVFLFAKDAGDAAADHAYAE